MHFNKKLSVVSQQGEKEEEEFHEGCCLLGMRTTGYMKSNIKDRVGSTKGFELDTSSVSLVIGDNDFA